MTPRFAFLLVAVSVSVQPASANVNGAWQPAGRIEPSVAQQTMRIAATTKQEAVQKRKKVRVKHAVKPKHGQEKWLNPQPEPPYPTETKPLKR